MHAILRMRAKTGGLETYAAVEDTEEGTEEGTGEQGGRRREEGRCGGVGRGGEERRAGRAGRPGRGHRLCPPVCSAAVTHVTRGGDVITVP